MSDEKQKVMPTTKVRKEEITSLERQALEGLSDVEKTNIGKQILFKKVYSPDYRMMGIGIAIGAPVGSVIALILCWYIWGLPLFLGLFA